MSILSALKTLRNLGDAAVVPKDIQKQIERIENLGGKLDKTNIPEIVARGNLTPSQIEALYKRLQETDSAGAFTEGNYLSWKRFYDKDPESNAAKTRQQNLATDLLSALLQRAEKKNAEENLEYIKEFNKGKPAKEQINFNRDYLGRPSFPKGYENVVEGYENLDLTSLVKKTKESADKAKIEVKPVKKVEGNVTTVDFTSLRRKE